MECDLLISITGIINILFLISFQIGIVANCGRLALPLRRQWNSYCQCSFSATEGDLIYLKKDCTHMQQIYWTSTNVLLTKIIILNTPQKVALFSLMPGPVFKQNSS